MALTAVLAVPAAAVTPASEAAQAAQQAADQLRASISRLEAALGADDQVTALTEVIHGYEQGLAALRAGLREAAQRESDLRARFQAQHDRLSRVLGAMTAMQQAPETALLLHPGGATATARSAMIVADIAPGLRAEAEALQSDLDEIATVRELQDSTAQVLGSGLIAVQEARRLLASAVTDRSHMPVRYAENPAELQALETSAASLDEFAAGVSRMDLDVGPPITDFEGAQGSLPLPVAGTVMRRYGEADAAGVSRPGLVIAAAPAALVTTPWPATIRFRGPLLDYGNVMILEPASGYLLVFAGLGQVFGEVGDVLAAGEPVGLMGGTEPPAQEFGAQFVADATKGGDAGQSQTLYLELRKGRETLNPADWFVMNALTGTQQAQD
ncbi:MAG: peptidoglycan DD-metalloendopeptidase family protein [Paracoccus sp. (in: a-proteobacteria)]|uniref:murein hydrolase activator EnvC family protein n=1 Tax=Paracoccus sp. TaxID=267 RepID=UPI0026E06C59|nr:peptidoglycan DD-metalloendopeptidase family protein [Paracoccus sp. (in: a-proteobacteria)]MDO5632540.1 peptidoglycan DD-metalloendopeptidase family protein [Paracoccus sp. (in: a-proteobacteria)]